MLAVKHCQFFQTAALEIFDGFQIFFQFIGNGGLGRTFTVLFVGFPNIPDNQVEVIQNHVAEIFIITDMGSLQHFQMRVIFAGAIPFNDFMPDGINKFLKFVLDDGERKDRVILSGIHEYYEPEELVGKTAIAIVNLPPRKMMGIDSEGMLISAVHEEDGHEGLNLLMVNDRIPAGAKLY